MHLRGKTVKKPALEWTEQRTEHDPLSFQWFSDGKNKRCHRWMFAVTSQMHLSVCLSSSHSDKKHFRFKWCEMKTHYSYPIEMEFSPCARESIITFQCIRCAPFFVAIVARAGFTRMNFLKSIILEILCSQFLFLFLSSEYVLFHFILFFPSLFQFHFRSFKLQYFFRSYKIHLCKMCSTYKFLMLLREIFANRFAHKHTQRNLYQVFLYLKS